MATVVYSRNTFNVDTVQWTGSNLDEIITFVGAAAVRYEGGVLEVHGEVVEVNDRVAKNTTGGAYHGKIKPTKLAVDYTAV